jgi:hypothetical protein
MSKRTSKFGKPVGQVQGLTVRPLKDGKGSQLGFVICTGKTSLSNELSPYKTAKDALKKCNDIIQNKYGARELIFKLKGITVGTTAEKKYVFNSRLD